VVDSVLPCGNGELEFAAAEALLVALPLTPGWIDDAVEPAATDDPGRPGWPLMSCGTETAAASTTPQPAAANTACLVLLRRAWRRIRSSESGGG
jgi:hypothetical protein